MRILGRRFDLNLRRRASSQVTGAALLLVGLVIGAGLVFVSSYVYGGLSTKTITEVSTQSVTQTITVTDTITSSSATGGGSNLITATASLVVPTGTGPGLLVVTIQNSAINPITGIQVAYTNMKDAEFAPVTCMGQTPNGLNCSGAAGSGLAACGATNAASVTKTVAFCNVIAGVATQISTRQCSAVGWRNQRV